MYAISFLFGVSGAYLIKRYAKILGFIDYPNNRSSHQMPTAKGGGIGILLAFITSSLMLDIRATIWVPISIIAIVSFYGDRVAISAKSRLILQFLCSTIVLFPFGLENIHANSVIFATLEFVAISIFIVGTANFYNFMDGIDGISATTGIIGFALLALNGKYTGEESSLIVLSISMCFACLGFLPFNIIKERIFMGDVGSILLGFLFAVMVYLNSNNMFDFIGISSFIFPYYADELTTMAIRIKNREKLTRAHRKHLYQIVANELKISHLKVSIAYGVIQCLIGISIIITMRYNKKLAIGAISLFYIMFAIVNYSIRCRINKRRAFSAYKQ